MSEIYVVFISMLPFVELRGSIPIGLGMGLSIGEVLLLGVLGNLIPILPVLYLFQPISRVLLRYRWYKRLYYLLFKKSLKKGKNKLDSYGAFGLFLFTAIPIPTTGAWSAAFLASFLQIKINYAFPAISLGVIVAGLIVASLSHLFF